MVAEVDHRSKLPRTHRCRTNPFGRSQQPEGFRHRRKQKSVQNDATSKNVLFLLHLPKERKISRGRIFLIARPRPSEIVLRSNRGSTLLIASETGYRSLGKIPRTDKSKWKGASKGGAGIGQLKTPSLPELSRQTSPAPEELPTPQATPGSWSHSCPADVLCSS